jgi:hypothetical protein
VASLPLSLRSPCFGEKAAEGEACLGCQPNCHHESLVSSHRDAALQSAPPRMPVGGSGRWREGSGSASILWDYRESHKGLNLVQPYVADRSGSHRSLKSFS